MPIPNLSPDWLATLSDLAVECLDSPPIGEGRLLRDAFNLLRAVGERHIAINLPNEERFFRLLECKAFESAGILLVGPNIGYLVSRSPEGMHLVSVNMPDASEVTFECRTVALGLVAGLVTVIVRLQESQGQRRAQERRVN